MANVKQGGIIANRKQEVQTQPTKQQSVSLMLNSLLDSTGIRKRIDEIMGKRAPQLCSSLISLANSSPEMQQAAMDDPMSFLQCGIKSATYDLPIGGALGLAYGIAFKNGKTGKYSCNFVMGYKGLYQLAMRTGAYAKINVCDIREGELKKWNPLTEDIEVEFIEDEDERLSKPIIGYCGFFRTINGMEKYVYWSVKKIAAHEKRHRKGKWQNPIWTSDREAMEMKTVLKEMLSRWGLMSIEYRTASPDVIAMADNLIQGNLDDDDVATIDLSQEQVEETSDGRVVDTTTGEVQEPIPEALFDAQ